MNSQQYHQQVALLIRIMPSVYRIKEFAVHGGTAINLFHQDMPRYSVDQVKITDANNISVLSTIFTLVQPEALSLKFKVISPNCSGGEGSIEALVTGGTAPYSYEWNKEGETNSSLRVNE